MQGHLDPTIHKQEIARYLDSLTKLEPPPDALSLPPCNPGFGVINVTLGEIPIYFFACAACEFPQINPYGRYWPCAPINYFEDNFRTYGKIFTNGPFSHLRDIPEGLATTWHNSTRNPFVHL